MTKIHGHSAAVVLLDDIQEAADTLATLTSEAAEYAGPTDDDNAALWAAIEAAESVVASLRGRVTRYYA